MTELSQSAQDLNNDRQTRLANALMHERTSPRSRSVRSTNGRRPLLLNQRSANDDDDKEQSMRWYNRNRRRPMSGGGGGMGGGRIPHNAISPTNIDYTSFDINVSIIDD